MLQLFAADYTYTYTTTTSGTPSGSFWAFFGTLWLLDLVLAIVLIIGLYKVFTKAGKPGWAAIIPVYNIWVLFELTGFPAWLSILLLVPFVNFAIAIVVLVAYYRLAINFGKGPGFGVLTALIPIVGIPMLGFGSAQYHGQGGAPAAGGYTPPMPGTPAAPGAAPYAAAPQPVVAPAQTPPPDAAVPAPQPPQDQQPPAAPQPPVGPVAG